MPATDDPAVKPPPLPPDAVDEVIDRFKPPDEGRAQEADDSERQGPETEASETPVPAASETDEHTVEAAEGALSELGHFLTDAGARVAELDELFAQATRPFRELEGILADARAAAEAAAAAEEYAATLEAELERSRADLDEVRGAADQADGAIDAERLLREESDARAEEAQARIDELERELREERDRVAQLEGRVAHAEVSIATSVQEANSARKRAEAARLEAEAARLEALAARQDVESAQLEAEAFLQEAGSARNEAERLRNAAKAAFEQMQAARPESSTDDPTAPQWLTEMLEPATRAELLTDRHTRETDENDYYDPAESDTDETWDPESAEPNSSVDEQAVGEDEQALPEADQALEEDEQALPEADQALEEDEQALPEAEEPTEEERELGELEGEQAQEAGDLEDDGDWSPDASEDAAEPPDDEVAQPTGPVSPLAWSHSAKLALTAVIVDAGTPRSLMEAVVRVIGSRGGWDIVIAWQLDAKTDAWACTEMWSAQPDEADLVEKDVKRLRLDHDSPIARAAADPRLGWLGGDDAATRAGVPVLEDEGLQSIVVLPLNHEGRTIGVIQLGSRYEGPPSEELRRALEALGAEVADTHQALEAVAPPEGPRWNKWRRRS
jgi:hypothetical protein